MVFNITIMLGQLCYHNILINLFIHLYYIFQETIEMSNFRNSLFLIFWGKLYNYINNYIII